MFDLVTLKVLHTRLPHGVGNGGSGLGCAVNPSPADGCGRRLDSRKGGRVFSDLVFYFNFLVGSKEE